MLGNDLGSSMLGVSWSPIKLPSLLHWYRFDNGITVDDQDDVTRWQDQKGSNHLTSTGAAANSPLYSSGAVMFNAAGDIMTFTSPLALGAFSIYIRSESDADGDIELYIDGSTDAVTKAGSNNHNIVTSTTFDLVTLGQPSLTSKYYEIVICSNDLSSTDRGLLNTYLNAI